ncbi:MAG: hypothetical protein Q4G70_05635 [Pseudomonadota bacterium]|nr:hypothetical protein [Pseudomonadota bacterium]
MRFIEYWSRVARAVAAGVLVAALAACAHPTALNVDTEPEPNDGLVTLRLVNASAMRVHSFMVRSLDTDEKLPLRAESFGQTQTLTFIGRLPAGRYQPISFMGAGAGVKAGEALTVPLDKATPPFEVQARRVTDLRTLVFVPLMETERSVEPSRANISSESRFSFGLSGDRTPVAVEALLKARLPKMAATMLAQPPLVGSMGAPDAAVRREAVQRTPATANPRFVNDHLSMAGGPLGVVQIYNAKTDRLEQVHMNTAHAIEAVELLADGRLLAGGEAGFLALNDPKRGTVTPIQLLSPSDMVLALRQAPDGRLYLVVDRDSGVAVYRAEPRSPTDWTLLRELPAERPDKSPVPDRAQKLRAAAAASNERLVIFAYPKQLHSMDWRTGQWETAASPRSMGRGFKVTPDGLVYGLGIADNTLTTPDRVITTTDYGRTWNQLPPQGFASQHHFISRQKGWMVALPPEFSLSMDRYLHTSQDGGQTWVKGPLVKGLPFDAGGDPLWADPAGKVLLRYTSWGMLRASTDGGVNWK